MLLADSKSAARGLLCSETVLLYGCVYCSNIFFSFEDSDAEANWQRYLVNPKKISHSAPLVFCIFALTEFVLFDYLPHFKTVWNLEQRENWKIRKTKCLMTLDYLVMKYHIYVPMTISWLTRSSNLRKKTNGEQDLHLENDCYCVAQAQQTWTIGLFKAII